MQLDLKRLAQIVEIDEARSFARAAERLGISQPALSRSLQALERELGDRLFDRSRSGVVPTPFGALVLDHARTLIRQAAEAKREIDLMLGMEIGHLRIGSGPYPAAISVGQAVARLIQQHPGISVTVEVNDAETLTSMVLGAELDLAVAELDWSGVNDRLSVLSLPRHAGQYFCRAGHPLARRRPLTPEDVREFPLVATPLPQRLQFIGDAQGAISAGRPRVQVNSFDLIRRIVLESDAVGLATRFQIASEVDAGTLVALEMAVPGMFSNYGIITLAGRTPSPAAEAFIALLQEVEASLAA